MDVKQRIIDNLNCDVKAVERAILVLDEKDLWNSKGDPLKTLLYQRAKYLGNWVKQGKHFTGKFVEEARKVALGHVHELVRCSLERSRELIDQHTKDIAKLKEWVGACEDELVKLRFEAEQPKPHPEEEGKPIWQICTEEGLY